MLFGWSYVSELKGVFVIYCLLISCLELNRGDKVRVGDGECGVIMQKLRDKLEILLVNAVGQIKLSALLDQKST